MAKVCTIAEDVNDYVLAIMKDFFLSEEGATAIEYALMAALIGATVIGAQTAMGRTVVSMYQDAANTIIAGMGGS
jgi:Flp pilus assembly pilin Flp